LVLLVTNDPGLVYRSRSTGVGRVFDVLRKAQMGELAGVIRVADRYRLTEVIGRGGMGTVWRAQDELLGRVVAVKVVTAPDDVIAPGAADATEAAPGAEARSPAAERARREARATARLNHPGAVTVHDVVEEGGRVHIVMELVDAPTLAQLVRAEGPLSPARAAEIGGRLLDVLEVAHAEGIVHRDVKPSNVMVLADGRVKLTDFGIAALRGDPQLTASGTTLGSPMFMAPEQAAGTAVGPAADLWSLGATMYFAVEGRGPFDRPTAMAVLAAVLSQPPDPPRLAGPLTPALAALLVRTPEDRPDGVALRRMLSDAVSGTGASVPAAAAATGATPALDERTLSAARTAAAPGLDVTATVDLRGGPATTEPPAADPSPASTPAPTPAPSPAPSPTLTPAPSPTLTPAPNPLTVAPPRLTSPTAHQDRRPARGGKVLAGLVGLLTAAVAALTITLLGDDDDDPAGRAGSGDTVVQQDAGAADGRQAGPTGAGGSTGGAAPAVAAAPLAPDAPSDGLALGSVGRTGVQAVEPAETGPDGQTLPRFFGSAANRAGGYAVGVPQAFDVVTAGPTTFVEWDDSMFRAGFEVRSYRSVDPWARLVQDERQFKAEHKDDEYKRQTLTRRWTYRGQDAAAWEFTWMLNGEPMHAREVAFRVGPRTYTVLYRSKDLWWLGGGSQAYPEGFERAFFPLP
jgi:serine/threonine protein kinase